jgi:hypothetical protein
VNHWLKQKIDIFELRVRAGRTKKGTDTYYCAGWADGYKAAQRDARKAAKECPSEPC